MRCFAAKILCLAGLLAAGFGGLSPAVAPAAPSSRQSIAALDSGILERLNAIRVAHHLVPLTSNSALATAATDHTTEMVADGYFGHDSAHGAPFLEQIKHYYRSAGYRRWAVGENLLWSSPGINARRAVSVWMASAEHRANILDPRWREIGIAAIHVTAAPGAYIGFPGTVITTDFGARK